MKKKTSFFAILFSVCALFSATGCDNGRSDASSSANGSSSTEQNAPVNVTISLNKTELSLTEDESEKLIATTNVSKGIDWESDNTTVATVSAAGKVIAKSEGVAKITAKIGSAVAVCTVTVLAAPAKTEDYIDVESVHYLSISDGTSPQIQPRYIKVTEDGESVDDAKTFTYRSMNPQVATVDETGMIAAVDKGTTDIVVSCGDVVTYVTADVYTDVVTNTDEWFEMINQNDILARYYLATDLDFTGVTYNMDNNHGSWKGFAGELNGDYHTLSNIEVTGTHQSLLGSANCAIVKNIAFTNVIFTEKGASGICSQLKQHMNVTDFENLTVSGNDVLIDGKVIKGAFKSTEMQGVVMFPSSFSNVILDASFVGHGNTGFCEEFYGGTLSNIYLNLRRGDDKAFSDADFAVCKGLYIWTSPNAASNVFVCISNGELSITPERRNGSRELPMDNVNYYADLMQANYQAYIALDENVFDVQPKGLPSFVKSK